MPPKKKRGRKKQQKQNTNIVSLPAGTTGINLCDRDLQARVFKKNMKDVPPEEVVERVRKGMGLSTHIICNLLASSEGNNKHQKYLSRLIDAGLISTVLALLQRCELESFDNVIETDGYVHVICSIKF